MIKEYPNIPVPGLWHSNPHRHGRRVVKFSWAFNAAILAVVTVILTVGILAQ